MIFLIIWISGLYLTTYLATKLHEPDPDLILLTLLVAFFIWPLVIPIIFGLLLQRGTRERMKIQKEKRDLENQIEQLKELNDIKKLEAKRDRLLENRLQDLNDEIRTLETEVR